MKDRQPIPFEDLGIAPETGVENDALKIQDLPRELTIPSTTTGERYGRLPTHYQNPADEIGKVSWIVEPGTERVDITPIQEGSIIERGREFLLAKRDQDEAEAKIAELKPTLKKDIEAIPGVTGIQYEKLGLGLTNIEQNSTSITDENELRERLGPEFYDLATQEVTLTLKIAKEILDRTGKPLTPKYLIQVVRLALEIILDDPEAADSLVNAKTKTTVDKKVAVTLWESGKIGPEDIEFKTTYALTPDSKPRTAPKA